MFWPFGNAYKIRSLNRDARYIVDDARARFGSERLGLLATMVRAHLDEARSRLANPTLGGANVLVEVKGLHREARRRSHDTALSALTLVIIYLEAEQLGPECEAARAAVDDLISEWGEEPDGEAEDKEANVDREHAEQKGTLEA